MMRCSRLWTPNLLFRSKHPEVICIRVMQAETGKQVPDCNIDCRDRIFLENERVCRGGGGSEWA